MAQALNWLFALLIVLSAINGQGQAISSDMSNKGSDPNPLLCDTTEGACAPGEGAELKQVSTEQASESTIRVIYFTDPICSSCWGIEPQLRKLKLEYGAGFEIEYRMEGLLPDWNYNAGGISKPSDVAHHWDKVSSHYDMPIAGDVWLEDPLHSSYPPSIAFKAAQLQDEEMAYLFLQEIREMVFMQKKNIARWENLEIAARKLGLDENQLKIDFDSKAKELFEEDLKLARSRGVRGFPTLYFVSESGEEKMVYGSKPYAYFEIAVLELQQNVQKAEYAKDWETLFSEYHTLTAKEFSELSGTPRKEAETMLNELSDSGKLNRASCKNGSIWEKP
jgi:predicted DsbA family dithiol-disulfide isomerase